MRSITVTVQNTGSATWTALSGFKLGPPPGSFDPFLVDRMGLISGGAPNSPAVFAGLLTAPASVGAVTLTLQMLQEDVAWFGEPKSWSITVGSDVTIDLTNNSVGWFGGADPNSNAGTDFFSGASGLCMTVPATGNNLVGWVSPERYIPLADMTAYRIRVTPTTDQTTTDAIPLWDITYDNFNTSGFGNTYAGELIIIDTTGGANGIGRGRPDFEVWGMPLAAQTPQWRGLLPTADNSNNAFTPHNDDSNDMRIVFRSLDLDRAPVAANLDLGTICFTSVRVTSFLLSAMSATPVWNPAIANATHVAQTSEQAAEAAGVATIDDTAHVANYQLTNVPGAGARKTLIPFTPPFNGFPSLYPVLWETDTVFKGSLVVRSNFNGGAGSTEGGNPLDTIFVNMDTADNELVNIHVTLVGSPDNMYYASSPRLPATVGNVPQQYSSFYFGHNVSVWPTTGPNSLPGVDHFRIQGDLFNTTDINGTQTGTDPLTVTSMFVERIALP